MNAPLCDFLFLDLKRLKKHQDLVLFFIFQIFAKLSCLDVNFFTNKYCSLKHTIHQTKVEEGSVDISMTTFKKDVKPQDDIKKEKNGIWCLMPQCTFNQSCNNNSKSLAQKITLDQNDD